jgi:tetratricopeptide (TPR) repeat protein
MSMTDNRQAGPVTIREELVEIPTYGIGQPDPNPMFLEKRVYQGSSGKVYPYPVIDKIEDEKKPKAYKILFLENEYVQIQIMPELGGRIYRALDKTNGYDFVYYNQVIKPALVGLAGPWISGGIEFNWPQHHRPNTFGAVEYKCVEHEDGSKTIWVSEIDRMYGTKGMAGFTLYPGKAYLEIQGQLYNRTDLPQTFLWWANPAVAVHDETQSVFPPDVHAVFDHGKRDVSRFPIATGTYYKMDYSAGVDISRYRNIPVPTSYMAYHSDYNFVGGYDHRAGAGILHVANHHISPGKKQWTWGNGEFGQAWDRHLTDEDGPYIELMTGVYTDNQPDFTWLMPHEEKTFKQYFMPYKKIGMVKNATIDAAVSLELEKESSSVALAAYATSVQKNSRIELTSPEGLLWSWQGELSPENVVEQVIELSSSLKPHQLHAAVYDSEGRLLVGYRPEEPVTKPVPDAAKAIEAPEKLANTEALWLAGLHLEQYRHATYEPDAYYLEGLKRDPDDIRLNHAYGVLLLRRGKFAENEGYLRRSVATSIRHNPNPYDGEPYYSLGLSLKLQGKREEAYNAFYKSVWSSAWHDRGYYQIALLDTGKRDYTSALEHIDKSIVRNYRSTRARNLKTAVLRLSGRLAAAEKLALETLEIDVTDCGSLYELSQIYQAKRDTEQAERMEQEFIRLAGGAPHHYMALAEDYCSAGLYREAAQVIRLGQEHGTAHPMMMYALAYALYEAGDKTAAEEWRTEASGMPRAYCFPTTLFELSLLRHAIALNPEDASALYYLGNLLYDKKSHEEAISCWERSAASEPEYPTVHRNLALAYYNKLHQPEQAVSSLEKAYALNPGDIRVLYELDQLYKKIGRKPEERLAFLEERSSVLSKRDDLYVEFLTLLNGVGRYGEARELLLKHRFHPWEGGEGKVAAQYVWSHVELAKQQLTDGDPQLAVQLLEEALVYPESTGEGKLAGAQENHVYYYLGCAWEKLGRSDLALECFVRASQGPDEPASAMYYNDQPPEMIFYQGLAWRKLKDETQARSRFNRLADFGETHLFKELKIDYFAVSLPDFLVFDENLDRKNEIHCRFMRALGFLGLGKAADAEEQLGLVLALDPAHQGALLHRRLDLTL